MLQMQSIIMRQSNTNQDWYNTTGNGFSIQKDVDYNIIKTVKMVQAAAKKIWGRR